MFRPRQKRELQELARRDIHHILGTSVEKPRLRAYQPQECLPCSIIPALWLPTLPAPGAFMMRSPVRSNWAPSTTAPMRSSSARARRSPFPISGSAPVARLIGPRGRGPGSTRCTSPFARSPAMVDAFYAAGLASGGRDNGPPGPRHGAGEYYGAFLLDPDGNNIEACFRGVDFTRAEPEFSS